MSLPIPRPKKPPADNEFRQLFKDGHRFNRKFKRRKSYEHSISISTDTSIAPSAPIIAGSVPSALPRHLPPLARNLQQDTVKKTSEPRRQELSNAVAPVAKRPTDFETLSTILGISRQEVLEPDMAGDPKSPSRMGSSIPHPSGSGSSNFLVDVEAPSENLGRKLPNEYLAALLVRLIRGMNDSDVDRLQPGKYLNDSLIEYGLRAWHFRLCLLRPTLGEKIHVFNTFFYSHFQLHGVQGGYERVKNWTLNKSNPGGTVDIFAKEFIVVPIHEENHWYLAVIHQPSLILTPMSLRGKHTTVYILDSLGRKHRETINCLSRYLQLEAKEKRGCTTAHRATGCEVDVPRQQNSTDCGIYLIHYAHVFVENFSLIPTAATTEAKIWDVGILPQYRTTMERELLRFTAAFSSPPLASI